jgi:uncharacterized membrane protein
VRCTKAAVVAAVLGSALFGVTAAGASSTPQSGTIFISVTPNNSASYPIVIAGAIADYGQATTIDQNGKVDPNGNYVKIALKQGAFEVNSTDLNKKANSAPPTSNNTTNCSFSFTATGPVTVFDGSGSYKGIAGTLTITESFVAILPRVTSGAHKGQCNESNSAAPLASNGNIGGSGKVSFS